MIHELEDNGWLICEADGRPVWSKLTVQAKLDDGTDVELRLCSRNTRSNEGAGGGTNNEEHSFVFRDEAETVTATLTFHGSGDALTVRVSAKVVNENPFGRQRAFAAEQAVSIIVGDLPGMCGLMANYRHKDWWSRPHFDMRLSELPPRTQSLLWKTEQSYYQLLPICGDVYRADISGIVDGLSVTLSSLEGGFDKFDVPAFVFGGGSDPFALAETNTATALAMAGLPAVVRSGRRYPEILDYLGWCSWDAFYHEVDERGLMAKAEELRELEVPVRWMMIDDGWLHIEQSGRRLTGFGAEPGKFPGGLSGAIASLKERYGVRWVGVWHTIVGYWGGVDPAAFPDCADSLYRTNKGRWIPYPQASRAFGFWHAWHSRLKREGVDFVKVDSQSAIANYVKDEMPVGRAAAEAHAALEASVALHFDGCMINCMGMASESIWHRPMSAVSRSSDDFVPGEERGFNEHALQNAYNGYYHAPFYWGDWDMFWTDNPDSVQHMMLRAVSGGPVYCSDPVGRTKPELLLPLVYRDGRIIRCDRPGLPTEDCLFVDPTRESVPLKIWNTAGGAGVIAAFHVYEGDDEVVGVFGPDDVPGLVGDRFVVYDRVSGKIERIERNERCTIRLASRQCEVYLLYPECGPITPIGLTSKVVSSDAVAHVRSGETVTVIRLKEGGPFAFAATIRPTVAWVDGSEAAVITEDATSGLYRIDCRETPGETEIRIRHDRQGGAR